MSVFTRLFSSSLFSLQSVDLGEAVVRVSVADILGKTPGPTFIVTAGLDGDEYAGMEAAYRLAEKYSTNEFSGRLIIIPILNIPGFEAARSYNPIDSEYPKRIYPGKIDGTPTQRLMHWLHTTYAYQAAGWIDLHGGALQEEVLPMIWTFKSTNAAVETMNAQFHEAAHSPLIVHTPVEEHAIARTLAKESGWYAMCESGGKGLREENAILQHITWAEAALRIHGMIPAESSSATTDAPMVTRTHTLYAPQSGIYRPVAPLGPIEKGAVIGTFHSLDMMDTTTLHAPIAGIVLWRSTAMQVRKNDVLGEVGAI